jgi:homoserine O-acetyltransferase
VVSYGTYGRLNAARDNVILLPSSYMADHHDNDWLIGRAWRSTPPAGSWSRPSCSATGTRPRPSNTPEPHHGPSVPPATIRDNIEAVHHLLVDELHVRRLAAVIGFSMGASRRSSGR